MDPFKRLTIEFNGIKEVIRKYTSDGNISNFLSRLEESLGNIDGEEIVYCLSEIDKWYSKNISAINSNDYVFNKEAHARNKALITELLEELRGYDFSKQKGSSPIDNRSPRIFLSHCSANKKYGDALEKLLTSIGIKSDQLIYTSHPLHKIPLDLNIYDYLRKNIGRNVFVIILWSNEYLDSPACLNEMGAAWVAQADYTNIYVPDFAFGNPKYHQCAVDTRKMGAVLNGDPNCKASMIEFKDKVTELFELSVGEQEWTMILDQFLEDIK